MVSSKKPPLHWMLSTDFKATKCTPPSGNVALGSEGFASLYSELKTELTHFA